MDVLENVQSFISSSKDLPSLPEVIIELNAMMAKHDLDINKLSKIIETDIAISTSILAMANSPLYRGLSEITAIKDGIMRIGIKETRNLVYSSSLMPLFNNIAEINPNNFWKHSIFTAYTAEILGEMIHFKNLSELYTCGLLHDMGVLVMGQFFVEELHKILKNTITEEGNINRGFLDVFNNMHSEVGGMLLKKWDLPENIVQCALYHHYPEQAEEKYQKEVKIIKLADEVTILEEYSFFNELNLDTYPFSIQFNSKKIIEIREKVKEKLSEVDALSSLLG